MITIVDSPCGKGKTSSMIAMMNERFGDNANSKFIYVTPFLDEVKRIKKEVPNRKFKEPEASQGKGRKLTHFKKLLERGNDIVTTHSLFSSIDEDVEMLLKNNDYILVLDEVFKVIDEINIGKDDVEILKEKYITVDDNGKVIWSKEGDYDGRYSDIRNLALNESLYTYGNNEFYYWCFPSRIFDMFKKCYILTYQFKYQIQKYYYDLFDVKYEYKSVIKQDNKYIITDYFEDLEYVDKFKSLVNIYEGKMNYNYFGKPTKYKTELSSTWYKKASEIQLSQLKKNLKNYFKNIHKSKTNEVLWSCYKSQKPKLKGDGYAKSWLEYSARATNNYRDRYLLAYMCNIYMNPFQVKFFNSHGVSVNQDGLALSTLIQWVSRSSIRDDKPIDLYLPSERMRNLLDKYFRNEL